MRASGGESLLRACNRMTAMVRTPVVPEATDLGPLSALLRHSKAPSGVNAFMRKRTVAVDDFHLTGIMRISPPY
jgi:hypothetical protein